MGKRVRMSILAVFLGLLVMVLVVYHLYSRIFLTNVSLDTEQALFYIYTGQTFADVLDELEREGIIEDGKSFRWVAEKKGYDTQIKPGRYKIRNGISNNELINMLRSGSQEPVMVVFNSIRTLPQLAGQVSSYLEGDSLAFLNYLANGETALRYGFEPATFPGMFIPNTYEFFWTASPEDFSNRMKKEYESFWKGDRDRRTRRMNLTREEVISLASIVDEETLHDDENAKVAGVYINRLDKGIPLQADPTLKFALGDFTRKRILNEDKKINSPYNTYKFSGLPPGPISIPSVAAIDGVLNHEKHNYFYFCAKPDFSGYHAFARTLAQHNRNAKAYQRVLNRNSIYR